MILAISNREYNNTMALPISNLIFLYNKVACYTEKVTSVATRRYHFLERKSSLFHIYCCNSKEKLTAWESRKHRESQNKLDPKRTTLRHIIIKMPKVNNKERIWKAAGEKQFPRDRQLISQKKLRRQEGTGKEYSKWWKARTYNLVYSIQQSYHLEWMGR